MTPVDVVDSPAVRSKVRLYAILLALFVAALDQTIIAISIPTICADLRSASGYVWIGGAYLVASAATGPIWAKFSDIWGRKAVLLVAVGLFAAASVLAALSSDMAMLIAARALQGTASGGLGQLVAIVISDLFSLRERSLYMGFVGFVWALAGSAGPLIGGAFTQYKSWRWCFWINLPMSGATFALLLIFLDVHNPGTSLGQGVRAVDWLGTLTMLATVLLLLVGLDFGGAPLPWSSPQVVCLLVFGSLMIGFFLLSEHRLARYPLIPLTVFRSWSNSAIFLVVLLHGMVLIGMEYYLPLYFQSVKQASPLRSGVLMLPLIVTQAVVEILSGLLVFRTGRYREFIWGGTALMALGTGLYITFGTRTSVAATVGLEILGGLGPALLFQGPMVAIQSTVSQSDTAAATAAFGFIRNIGMALSVVVGGVAFQNSMDAQQPALAASGLDKSILDALSGAQAAANVGVAESVQDPVQHMAILEAFATSMRNMFIMYTCLAAVAAAASLFIQHRDLSTEHTETKTGIKELTRRKGKAGS
ncbi:MFS multidrug transporter-like protein [Coniella lustricola]|uniref:Efflux pump dotC n=1 Tax=Coniella lustricola TaxID=2025994 RepID=A0A2T2ZYI8_9PEZI|nr:MFS multidrug transporter-like protein [Coniella lustricola]